MTNDSYQIYEAYKQSDENNESIPPVVRSLTDILASGGKAIHGVAPKQDIDNEETQMHQSRMVTMADEIEVIANNLLGGQIDEDNIQQLLGIAEEIRREYR